MDSVGDAYDNAVTESSFAALECELLDRCRFATRTHARTAVFDCLQRLTLSSDSAETLQANEPRLAPVLITGAGERASVGAQRPIVRSRRRSTAQYRPSGP
jgi:hypothetical protein